MSVKLTYAGHSAVLCEFGDQTVAIDPWLKGNPSCPDKLKNPEKIDLIVLTHGHADHASEAAELSAEHNAKVCACFELCDLLVADGASPDNMIGMNAGGCVQVDGLTVCLTEAIHSSSYQTSEGAVYAGISCGAVVKNDDNCIFHAGDTSLFSDMKLIGDIYQPDVAFVPIGDVFTMDPRQAALASRWLACKTAVPIHYGTFPVLTGTPEEFQAACQANEVNCQVMQPGEEIEV